MTSLFMPIIVLVYVCAFVCVILFHSHSCLQPRTDHRRRGLWGAAVSSHTETLTNRITAFCVSHRCIYCIICVMSISLNVFVYHEISLNLKNMLLYNIVKESYKSITNRKGYQCEENLSCGERGGREREMVLTHVHCSCTR